ncbi:MAG: SMC-Scp complex subunit ScpB, partial [Propionibacterium freudenreichii]
QLRHVGGGWRYYTRAAQHERIAAWVRAGGQNRLSQAAMETLAVIAYLQPVARSRVSAVRGVNVDGVVRTLLSRGLVDERGSDAQTGAGLLVTTDYFLSRLGLSALSDLPDIAPLLPDAAALEAELTSLAAPAGSDASSQATNEAAPRDRPDDGGRDEVPQEGSHTNG